MALTSDQIRQQSLNAYAQWKEKWRVNARAHSKHAMRPLSDFEHVGVGKAILCVGNGYSFEAEIEAIKKHHANVDVMACDKTLGHLLENGVKPTYVVVCDANVSYKKYMEKWKDQLQDTVLFMNVCGNTKWTENGNWKDIYFFANEDVIASEKEFMDLSGCPNMIPAATNVSNALVVFLTQSNNSGRKNHFGYDKILLIGFDYCWRADKNYYAFDWDGSGKRHYMRHIYARTIGNDYCYTSNNLAFSAQWLDKYVNTFNLPVVQCGRDSVFVTKHRGKLDEQMQYRHKTEDSFRIRDALEKRRKLMQMVRGLEQQVIGMGRDHHYAFVASV